MFGAWHTQEFGSVLQTLHTSEKGLSSTEALERLARYGKNALPEAKRARLSTLFLRQFKSPLIYVLLAASAAVFFLGEVAEGCIILAVLLFNAVIGTIQEGRAQNTLHALRSFIETNAVVVRDGKERIIPDTEVVRGDVVILQEGEKVPADARLILAHSLLVSEAALTGESESVMKSVEPIEKKDSSPAEQSNMVFKGTYVVGGNGRAVVVDTGTDTVIGRIAQDITKYDTEIPLQTNIRNLSRLIILVICVVCSLFFMFGYAAGYELSHMFRMTVAVAVSAVPEGLPLVLTIVLAAGVWHMGKRNALVKRLQAVEALGQAQIIAVDKTGTLTRNEIVVERVYTNNTFFSVSGEGYEPKGHVELQGKEVLPTEYPELERVAHIAACAASAHVMYLEDKKEWKVSGDPTEAALLVFARKLGFLKGELEVSSPLIAELPFSSDVRYHAILHRDERGMRLAVVGAPEVVLARASAVYEQGKRIPLSNAKRTELETKFLSFSEQGLRVVALAEKEASKEDISHEDIEGLTLIGFLGMKDGLRAEVPEAMRRAREAGIRVVMITGDHKIAAQAIAREAGIFLPGSAVLTGDEMDTLSDVQLAEVLGAVTVFARMTPEHKLRVVKAYRARGEIIAMTGDGVNDAPSLVAADLGVAMGKIGTEVAKEASDIVLLDDNFGSIVSAVEEGRGIYRTIKKVFLYLFSTNIGEMLTITGALALLLPLPLMPAQIIWLNFVTDGFLTGALAMEPKEKGLLTGGFERPRKYLIDAAVSRRILLMASTMAVGTLGLFAWYLSYEPHKALTVSLTTLAVFQWFRAWGCRSESQSVFTMNPFSNLFLVGATGIIICLQLTAVYAPFLQSFLYTTSLALSDWLLITLIGSSILLVDEVRKFFVRRTSSFAPASHVAYVS